MSARYTNRWDSLLAWLSQNDSYSLATVKAAALRLSTLSDIQVDRSPYGHAMYWAGCLITLGHAEFDPSKTRVSAVSPGMLRCENLRRTVLYGYWSPKLIQAFRLSGFRLQIHRPKRGPTCYSLQGDSNKLESLSSDLNVWFACDASSIILARLPSIASVVSQFVRIEVGTGGSWEVFESRSNRQLRWRVTHDPLVDPGLYRRTGGAMAYVYVDSSGGRFAVKSRDERLFAKWDCAPKYDWICDPLLRRLLIPYGMPDLPLLVSRGLTASSARMPTVFKLAGKLWWNYVSVGEDQAREAARIMEQELKTESLRSV